MKLVDTPDRGTLFQFAFRFAVASLIACCLLNACDRARSHKIEEINERIYQGKYPEALRLIEAEIRKNPKDVEFFFLRGWANLNVGLDDAALADFGRCVNMKPTFYGGHKGMGALYLKNKLFSQAEASFRTALSHNPKSPDLHASLGEALLHQLKYSEAVDSFARATELAPNLADYHLMLARMLFRVGDLDAAQEALMAAQKHPLKRTIYQYQLDCLPVVVAAQKFAQKLEGAKPEEIQSVIAGLKKCQEKEPAHFEGDKVLEKLEALGTSSGSEKSVPPAKPAKSAAKSKRK